MAKLHEELSKCLVRAGLWSAMVTVQSLSGGRRHSWAHSSSQARSPSADPGGRKLPSGQEVTPCQGAHSPIAEAIGAEYSSRVCHQSASQQVRHIPGLPWDPTGIPCYLLAHHSHTTWTNNCTALQANFICSPRSGNIGEGVRRMQSDSALIHATGCPHSPSGSVTECLPQSPAKKQVHFNLTRDLGNTPPLPNDLACFFGDTTDEQIDAPCPPSSYVMSSLRLSCNSDDQCHDTPWEEPGQRPVPLHGTSLWLPV